MTTQSAIQKCLDSLEGHIHGIQRMLDEQAACEDLLIQTSAARGADPNQHQNH